MFVIAAVALRALSESSYTNLRLMLAWPVGSVWLIPGGGSGGLLWVSLEYLLLAIPASVLDGCLYP